MTKLVEEVVISSDVLVDVLVQVGFLDKAFEDGKAVRIDAIYGFNEVDTYNIKIEKEIKLKDIKDEKVSGVDIPEFPYEKNEEKKVLHSSLVEGLISTPCPKLIKTSGRETVLSKKDAEKLLNNINVSDKLTTNIINTLNKSKEVSNENDEERSEVDERDDLGKIVDLLAYLKESVDILNADKCNAENFAQKFIDRIKIVKGSF